MRESILRKFIWGATSVQADRLSEMDRHVLRRSFWRSLAANATFKQGFAVTVLRLKTPLAKILIPAIVAVVVSVTNFIQIFFFVPSEYKGDSSFYWVYGLVIVLHLCFYGLISGAVFTLFRTERSWAYWTI